MLTERALLDGFRNPPATYRPQPFWFINHELDPLELKRQVRMMHDKGVGGFIYHARHGLGQAFMTPEWLAGLRAACEQAHELGMDVWLYDEDNWPSGTYGGRLTKAHPEFRMRYLRYWEQRVSGPQDVALEPVLDDNTLYGAVLAPLIERDGKAQPVTQESVDVTDAFDGATGTFTLSVPEGDYIIGLFFICPVPEGVTFRNGWYLDTMDREACQTFVESCYVPNMAAVEGYVGATVKGIFTDEPGLMIHDGFMGTAAFRPTISDPKGRLPGYVLAWSRRFPEMFREWRGYDLRSHLLALVYETSADDLRVRQDYFQTCVDAYLKHYWGAIRTFAHTHGLKLIGHTLEEPVWAQARSQGNQHQVLAQLDLPGYDYLLMQAGIATEENPSRLLAGQCAYSVAALKGGERIMVEAFGGSGNEATLAQRRRHTNMMALMGTSLFVPHAFWQSFAGERKSDWPPSEFYQAAFWDHYDYFADYIGRIGMLAHAGKPVSPLMVLSPIHTAYRQIASDGQVHRAIDVDKTFSALSYQLLKMQRNHIYIDETHLRQARIVDGAFSFNDYVDCLPVIIIPDVSVIEDQTVSLLHAFLDAGGKILWLGQMPSWTTSGQPIGEDAFTGTYSRRLGTDDRAGVQALLDEWLPLDRLVSADGDGHLLTTWKALDEGYLALVFNSDEDLTHTGTLTMGEGAWTIEELDTETGQTILRASGVSTHNIELTPSQLVAYRITPTSAETQTMTHGSEPTLLWHTVRATRFETQKDNLLPLDEWQVKLSIRPEERPPSNWMRHTTVNRHVTHFAVDDIPEHLMLLIDDLEQYIPAHYGVLSGYRAYEITLNGQILPAAQRVDYPDHYLDGIDIASFVRKGDNEIALFIAQSNERPAAPALEYPMMLCGSFSLGGAEALVAPDPTAVGYWDETGAPYYSGIGCYTFTIQLPQRSARLVLDLGDVHESARIVVNDAIAATRGWEPYIVQVPAEWRAGANTVEVQVGNTAANLWEKRRLRSGISGEIRWALC